jgi:cell fate (sporulation/competence/biofilm development) regulator YlbF (YheA/YmcA/DUF963 family)
MAVDTQQIMQEAERLGQLVAQHPAVNRYKEAQRAVQNDPEASRMMADFGRQMEMLERQAQAGMDITDAQRMQIEQLQGRIIQHIKIKALNQAQVEFIDLFRRVSQTIQRQVAETGEGGAGPAEGAGAPAGGAAAASGAGASKLVL